MTVQPASIMATLAGLTIGFVGGDVAAEGRRLGPGGGLGAGAAFWLHRLGHAVHQWLRDNAAAQLRTAAAVESMQAGLTRIEQHLTKEGEKS